MKKRISTAQRKHQDYLRQKGLKVGQVYMNKLITLRSKEARRVLALCRDYDDVGQWRRVIENNLSEAGYMYDWYTGLYLNSGLPQASSVIRDLTSGKAEQPGGIWEEAIRQFAAGRAGNSIVSVTGTFRDELCDILRTTIENNPGVGVETLTKKIMQAYTGNIATWQARRIAQTETMISLGEAGALAAETSDIQFTKTWCISGVGNTRESHEVMDGVTIDGGDYFQLEDCVMLYPHDTGSNPPAGEIINCACSCIRQPKKATTTATSSETYGIFKPAFTEQEQSRILDIVVELPNNVPEETRKAIAENCLIFEKTTGFKKGNPMSSFVADDKNANPNFGISLAFEKNCSTCSAAYLMRIRGFKVTAAAYTDWPTNPVKYLSYNKNVWKKWRNADGSRAKFTGLKSWAEARNITSLTPSDYYQFFIENTREVGIYEVSLSWGKSGHSMILQRFEDGSIYWIDAQSGARSSLAVFDSICKGTPGLVENLNQYRGIMRIDDKLFNTKFYRIFRKGLK